MTVKRVNSRTSAKLRILVQKKNRRHPHSQYLKRVTQKEEKTINSWGVRV